MPKQKFTTTDTDINAMTQTQLLERIYKKLDERPVCIATQKEYEDHCLFIEEWKVLLPQVMATIKSFEKALAKGETQFREHNDKFLVMETERKTAVWIVGVIGGVIGAIAGWLSKHL